MSVPTHCSPKRATSIMISPTDFPVRHDFPLVRKVQVRLASFGYVVDIPLEFGSPVFRSSLDINLTSLFPIPSVQATHIPLLSRFHLHFDYVFLDLPSIATFGL
jgi:hypothetical protein